MNKVISINAKPEQLEPHSIKPYYEVNAKGVHHISVKDGEHTTPERLSDPIYIIGRGTDNAGAHYRVIDWQDRISKEKRQYPISMAEIGTAQGWQRLQGLGLTIFASRRKRDLLADYLMTEGHNQSWRIANRAGWQHGAYILPSGEVMQTEKTRIIYNGDRSQASYYQASGTLEEWQEIANLAEGNSRLCLALGAAFAAPLMRLLDVEGGGFHLYGDSSDGKTTAAKFALSVWGKPDDIKLTWEGTGHGFTNTANARNDGLLVLDEIGQAAPRVVAHTAYAVINGTGKVQGHKDGGNREINRWRVLVLSTGEKTLQGYLKSGGADWQAGQANRLPSIPANAGKGLGIFDTLHQYNDGADLAEYINHGTHQCHGIAGRRFVEKLIADPQAAKERAKEIMKAFTAMLPKLTGQSRRVGTRFALAAAALELANHWGIIHLSTGITGIKQCFDDWDTLNGCGKYEDKRIIEQTEGFMQQHAQGHRFSHWGDKHTSPDHAGYYRYTFQELKAMTSNDEGESLQEYWIIPAIFEKEICQGFDSAKVCTVLSAINWLKPSKEGDRRRWKHKRYGRGRYYVLVGIEPPYEE